MALTEASLSTAIKAEIQSEYGGAPDDAAKLQKFADAMARAVVNEIKNNAVVVGTVTSGLGSGGDVTGTVT